MTMRDADIARLTELYDTIPGGVFDITVTASAVTVDLNRLDLGGGNFLSLAGKRVRFRAITAAITFLADTVPGLTIATGVPLALNTDSQRYFIPPCTTGDATRPLTVISSGGATLRVFYSVD